ncbi:methionine synthase [Catellatospora tritici]|uniref:methionine synthase n=1 Tax=Catellatospora tritici TaxID=2851566 RepID=UPI001C2D86AC|nr:methionine synthase [Catellatospora tritici]MBV1848770.1 methionine synthase [Catellatospora tritici]
MSEGDRPLWPAGSATGIGSLPGTDVAEAVKFTLGELPDLPYLPELPARGPGADMIGRGATFLVDLPIELYTGRWRVAASAGREMRQAYDFLERDLDQLTEQADGYTGTLKIQAAGPWTLASSIELPLGEAMVSDHGAARDLAESLAEGLKAHVADVRRRVPGATVLLQLDEPSLPAVLAGRVRTASTLHTYRSVPRPVIRETIASVVAAVGAPVVVHCCAPDAPLDLLREAGAAALAIDLDLLGTDRARLDSLGEAIDAGLGLFAGVARTTVPANGRRPDAAALAERLRRLWRDLGFAEEQLASSVVVTPACGLAGATPAYAQAVLKACHEAARRLTEQ